MRRFQKIPLWIGTKAGPLSKRKSANATQISLTPAFGRIAVRVLCVKHVATVHCGRLMLGKNALGLSCQ